MFLPPANFELQRVDYIGLYCTYITINTVSFGVFQEHIRLFVSFKSFREAFWKNRLCQRIYRLSNKYIFNFKKRKKLNFETIVRIMPVPTTVIDGAYKENYFQPRAFQLNYLLGNRISNADENFDVKMCQLTETTHTHTHMYIVLSRIKVRKVSYDGETPKWIRISAARSGFTREKGLDEKTI